MSGKRKKIVIGLPVALIVTAVVWFSIVDKTNRTIVSSCKPGRPDAAGDFLGFSKIPGVIATSAVNLRAI